MIKRVRLINWKSHKDSEFEFSKGTNVLIGILGSGKSSLMEAVSFALFGTFPGLKARRVSLDEVIMNKPSEMDFARIELDFSYNEKLFSIEREIKRGKHSNEAKLKQDGTLIAGPKPTDVTKRIEEILEINYDLFSRAVYSEQNQIDFFLRLSPSQRKEKFDQLLDLEKYSKARNNAIQLSNRIKKMVLDKEAWLQEIKKEFDEKELEKAGKKILGKEKELKELLEKFGEKKKELKEKKEELESEEKKEKEFRFYKELSQKMGGKIELIEQEIRETEKKFNETVSESLKEKLAKKLKEKLEEKKLAEEKKNKLLVSENSLKGMNEKKELLEERQRECRKGIPAGIKNLAELEKEAKKAGKETEEKTIALKKSGKELEALVGEKTKNQTLSGEIEKSMVELSKAGAKCPVCETQLQEAKKTEINEHKQNELSLLKEKISKLEAQGKKLEAEEKNLEQELEKTKKNQLELGNAERFLKDSTNLKEQAKKLAEEIKAREKELSLLSETLKATDLKDIEEEIGKNEKLLEATEKLAPLKGLKEELKKAETQAKEIGFDEKAFNSLREAVAGAASKIEAMEREEKSLKEFISSLKQSQEKLFSVKESIKKTAKEVGLQKDAREKMNYFTNALTDVQSELRQTLTETINQAMQDIWPRLYPYRDLVSAKMEIEEGSYELKVKENSGKWTRVEGILSGGERNAAAICIRIAFSLVLTQNLSWLILDEPTHNLDRTAVKELSAMMRNHLPELVDQIFLITHDQEMERAASASLYLLERNKEENGVSIPRKLQVD